MGIRLSFTSNLLIFCERKSDLLVKKSELLPLLFCLQQPEQITHSHSFVKRYMSKLLKTLFKKERMSQERWERFALWPINGEKLSKMYKQFFERFKSRANHSHCSFLKSDKSDSLTLLFCNERHEPIAHGRSLKRAILSKRAKSNSQP